MLVLSRKTGERAIIAGNIRVVVLSVHKDRVKLGFEAPDDVSIHREEVRQRIAPESPALTLAGEREHMVGDARTEPKVDPNVESSRCSVGAAALVDP